MKTIVITGATAGIGKEAAKALAQQGFTVISNARNLSKAAQVRQQLVQETGNQNVYFFEGDFSNLQSVQQFAQSVAQRFPAIDVLINNAGTWEMERKNSHQGIEMNFAVNHLAPMLLTLLLLPVLKKTRNARIVNTASGAHRRNILNLDDIEFKNQSYNGVATYSQSKLCNILFSLQLQDELKGTGITVNTIHPGIVHTDLFKNMEARDWNNTPNAAHGARSALYAALSPDMEDISGKYIYLEQEDPNLSPMATNKQYAQQLWNLSLQYLKNYC
ncbi:KR domain-containing protein [Sphingobacteriales bacterium UPWRP_1]|nr:hypothetical protein BVG80_15750 [Sphingobacteriales bacterium TSM_CSM]PSJ75037.1 KR domain-containing protein [Sphingobacteriales bacterium UPWRP_1]